MYKLYKFKLNMQTVIKSANGRYVQTAVPSVYAHFNQCVGKYLDKIQYFKSLIKYTWVGNHF